MTKLRQFFRYLPALLPLAVATPTLANDKDIKATTIPAAACVPTCCGPAGTTSSWPTRWASGGFVVMGMFPATPGVPRADNAVDQRFQCAFPLNALEKSTSANDNDLSGFRVLYFDSDGAGAETQVRITLYRTTLLVSGTFEEKTICQWSSTAITTGWTRALVPCVHDLGSGGALYRFEVSLYTAAQTSGQIMAGFAGIDFP